MLAQSSARGAHHTQRSLWGRFLDQLLPDRDPDRLVAVGEVAPGTVPFVEESLHDAEIPVAVRELMGLWGAEARFQVLVPARDAAVAAEIVGGLTRHPRSGL